MEEEKSQADGMEQRVAAAVAGVFAYLEQEAAALQPSAAAGAAVARPVDLSLWGHSGRQQLMAERQLMQMRALRR